jgi:hypothetical protein
MGLTGTIEKIAALNISWPEAFAISVVVIAVAWVLVTFLKNI